jgi:hypothetical protein
MKELHVVSLAHNGDLINVIKGGLSQGQIDEILTLKNELSDANKEQNLYKRGRPVLSNDRIKVLNDCYQFEADVNEAGKIIFEDDPEMVKLFTYDPGPASGGGGEPNPDLATLEGTATVDGYSFPVEGVNVELKQGATVVYSTTTDVNGNYEIVNIELGAYDLVLTKEGFSPKMINNLVFEQEGELTEDVALVFLGATVSGAAKDINTLNPLVNASIRGYEDGDPANYIEALTDASGNYLLLISISSSTNITLDCNATGYLQEQNSFIVNPGSDYQNRDFSLTPVV